MKILNKPFLNYTTPLPYNSSSKISNVVVSFPQGAGGSWLSCVLTYCNDPTVDFTSSINFHNSYFLNKIEHNIQPSDNVISIGNDSSRYNFWRQYCYKTLIYELNWYRYRGQRLVKHYNNISPRNDFFWIVNQCKFIQCYNYQGQFNIQWRDLFIDPLKVWQIICAFLEHNQIQNYINFKKFIILVEKYKSTIVPINLTVNTNHKLFLIWCFAFLQNQSIEIPFDVFEQFDPIQIKDWVLQHQPDIIKFTKENTLDHTVINGYFKN